MKAIGVCLLSILLPGFLLAQKFEAGLLLGASNYFGDLVGNPYPNALDSKPAGGILLRYNLTPKIAVRGSAVGGQMFGSDLGFSNLRSRGYTFEGLFYEGSMGLEWNILGKPHYNSDGSFLRGFTPYLYFAGGLAKMNPKVEFNPAERSAQELANLEMDRVAVENLNFIYSGILGGGLKMNLSPRVIVGAEAGIRVTRSDHVDGISFAGNPGANDWYFVGGATVSFRLGRPPVEKIADNSKEEEEDALEEEMVDTDGDGIADLEDHCPDEAGNAAFTGCPDTDGDGISDLEDRCPEMVGLLTTKGCPDADEDGVADIDDKCPSEAGMLAFGGCPDTDSDGVADIDDNCPDEAGETTNNGCPETFADIDKDGVMDSADKCPNLPGIERLDGCPDSDEDGIVDTEDDCPNEAGPSQNGGCPDEGMFANDSENGADYTENSSEGFSGTTSGADGGLVSSSGQAAIKTSIDKLLNRAKKVMKFDLSSPDIKPASYYVLDEVAEVMKSRNDFFLTIHGFTDNTGEEMYNRTLSMRRARRVFRYLANQGVSPYQMRYVGMGSKNPVAPNDTPEGRQENRRVEFEFSIR